MKRIMHRKPFHASGGVGAEESSGFPVGALVAVAIGAFVIGFMYF